MSGEENIINKTKRNTILPLPPLQVLDRSTFHQSRDPRTLFYPFQSPSGLRTYNRGNATYRGSNGSLQKQQAATEE